MSTIKVNTIETRTGSTLTLGKSGDTVSIASGASTSGMGRTGTVDWQTSSVKTSSFTGVSGEGYFIDTADSGAPFKNYAITVASGTLYGGGGSGNIFKLDGSTQQAITLMKGKTYRFTQSDATNDGHPLIISTSNSGTLSTFKAGIVSSGITYYLDGASNQSNYTNTTPFNAATTRYIEFQPQTTGTFYFGCWVHGIGMGGAITSQNVTLSLPAGSAGAIVSVQDYNNAFDNNNVTIDPNGSEKINGGDAGQALTLSTEGQGLTLVYVNSTVGWRSIHSDDFNSIPQTPVYVAASGGNTTTTSPCGNYKSHIFTAPGTFTVSNAGNASGSNSVDYLIVAGGGGTPGGAYNNTPAGGSGAGGFRASATTFSIGCQPAKPLVCGVSAVEVSATAYPIVVGAGGAGGSQGPGNPGAQGSSSSGLSLTSAGGGRGGHTPSGCSGAGGPGGGGGMQCGAAGAGNTPPVSPPQGNPGGLGVTNPANPSPGNDNRGIGGGGGAIQPGFNGGTGTPGGGGGDGGDGAGFAQNTWGATGEVTSCVQYFAGGGGGGVYTPNPAPNPGGVGGLGGGGNGGSPANPGPFGGGTQGETGTANTGGGSGSFGGAPSPSTNFAGNAGGSGIVIIRYKFQ